VCEDGGVNETPGAERTLEAGRSDARVGVVVNGNARSVTADVLATLDEVLDSGDIFLSRRIEDSDSIARTLLDRGYGTILTAGGDGTFTVIVTAVVKEARRRGAPLPRFGLLRLGTGNSLAWVLGASKAGKGGRGARALTVDLARLRADAGSRMLRLVEVDGVLSPFCGFGVDANVLKRYGETKKLLARGPLRPLSSGLFAYGVATVTRVFPEYLVKPLPHCRAINRGSDVHRIGKRGALIGAPIKKGSIIYEGPATIAAVSTIPYYGFGLRLFPYADERPDRMQLRISTAATIPFIRNVREIWRGEWDDPEYMFDYYVDAVDIEMDPPTSFQIGGDVRDDRRLAQIRLADPVPVVDFYAPPRGRP
jgi:diacylglycerol kinase family enzyme